MTNCIYCHIIPKIFTHKRRPCRSKHFEGGCSERSCTVANLSPRPQVLALGSQPIDLGAQPPPSAEGTRPFCAAAMLGWPLSPGSSFPPCCASCFEFQPQNQLEGCVRSSHHIFQKRESGKKIAKPQEKVGERPN